MAHNIALVPRHSSTVLVLLCQGLRGHCSFLSLHSCEQLREEGPSCDCPGSVGLARESSLSPHREGSAEQPTHGWAPTAQTANREMAPRTAPNQWELGPKAQRQGGAVGELEPTATIGMQSQRGEHTAETNLRSPQIPPASPALLPVCSSRGQGSRCRRHSSSLSAYPDPAVLATLQEG